MLRQLVAVLLLSSALHAPRVGAQPARGTVHEGLAVSSEVLGREVRYTVYLPPNYDAEHYYPAVYLLHGYGDDHMSWIAFGEAHLTADEALAQLVIPPMILVMPDGGTSFYVDSHDGAVRYEQFFVEELIPHVERTFRVRADRRARAVAGPSMGGYGALLLGLRHPDQFGAVAALSASVRTDEEVIGIPDERWDGVFGPTFGAGLRGADRLTPHWRSYAPLDLARDGDLETLRSVRWWLDCGDDDLLLYRGNAALHVLLRDRAVPHEYRVRNGGHDWVYWRGGLADALTFIGEGFQDP